MAGLKEVTPVIKGPSLKVQMPKLMAKINFLVFTILISLPSAALAVTWDELDGEDGYESGDLLSNAQVTEGAGSLTTITGTFPGTGASLPDLYAFSSTGGSFTATTVGGTTLDTALFLFDSAGMGIRANDDSIGFQSTIPSISLTAGIYYIGISLWDIDPFSLAGEIFPDSPFTGVFGPTGPGGGSPLDSWAGSLLTGTSSGSYIITLTGAFSGTAGGLSPGGGVVPVPEIPVGMMPFLLSFLSLAVFRIKTIFAK